jgi:hypothetical protein
MLAFVFAARHPAKRRQRVIRCDCIVGSHLVPAAATRQ